MKQNLFFFILLIALQVSFFNCNAQKSVKLYRSGMLFGSYSTIDSALKNATVIGDSLLLSAHTFYEYNLLIPGGIIMQGTWTLTDTTIVDAEAKGIIANPVFFLKGKPINIRDIIFQNGAIAGGFGGFGIDTIMLRGRSIIRNCSSLGLSGAIYSGYLYDHVKITGNHADSYGGAGCELYVFDSVEISYNTAAYGGAIGWTVGGVFTCNSPGVRIHHNTATIAGGAFYGDLINMTAGQITDNQAPLGAALHTITCGSSKLQNCLIYNPLPSGKRQNEIYIRSGVVSIEGSWFGQNDTVGLIRVNPPGCAAASARNGRAAKANWSINRGKALNKKDTLFPIGAVFTYSDGMPLPVNSLPWLRGSFSANKGTVLTPNPIISPLDTMFSIFRTYTYAKGDTGSKPVSFVCIVDADTFRTTPLVWGRDTSNLSIGNTATRNVLVYPNPATEILYIDGAEVGSSIALYDMQGKLLIRNDELLINNATIDIKAFPVGFYTLKIITKNGEVGTAKVRKE